MWTTITSFSAFVRVFMLMFSFMLCSFKRKSNLGFSCSPDHFGKLLSFIYSFKIWKFGHQIISVKWYPSYKYVLIWDMKTSSPGHVEAELVAKYLINFIDIQNLDQVNLKKNILGKTLKIWNPTLICTGTFSRVPFLSTVNGA